MEKYIDNGNEPLSTSYAKAEAFYINQIMNLEKEVSDLKVEIAQLKAENAQVEAKVAQKEKERVEDELSKTTLDLKSMMNEMKSTLEKHQIDFLNNVERSLDRLDKTVSDASDKFNSNDVNELYREANEKLDEIKEKLSEYKEVNDNIPSEYGVNFGSIQESMRTLNDMQEKLLEQAERVENIAVEINNKVKEEDNKVQDNQPVVEESVIPSWLNTQNAVQTPEENIPSVDEPRNEETPDFTNEVGQEYNKEFETPVNSPLNVEQEQNNNVGLTANENVENIQPAVAAPIEEAPVVNAFDAIMNNNANVETEQIQNNEVSETIAPSQELIDSIQSNEKQTDAIEHEVPNVENTISEVAQPDISAPVSNEEVNEAQVDESNKVVATEEAPKELVDKALNQDEELSISEVKAKSVSKTKFKVADLFKLFAAKASANKQQNIVEEQVKTR